MVTHTSSFAPNPDPLNVTAVFTPASTGFGDTVRDMLDGAGSDLGAFPFPPLAARLGVTLSAATASSIAAIATNFVKDISLPHFLNPRAF